MNRILTALRHTYMSTNDECRRTEFHFREWLEGLSNYELLFWIECALTDHASSDYTD